MAEKPTRETNDQPLTAQIEAILLATDRPMTEARLAEVLELSGSGASKRVQKAIEELNSEYEKTARSFRAERVAGGWQIMTLPTFGPLLQRLHTERQQSRLSQPALETLAVIAYRQPIMRAEIEAIRGVACGEVLRSLIDRRLIKVTGRAEELGRPMLYGTTREFLTIFGLANIDDLPPMEGELNQSESKPKKANPSNEDSADDSSDSDDVPEAEVVTQPAERIMAHDESV